MLMPWSASDAKSHTKAADTPEKQKKWATVANAALKTYKGDEGKAIASANAAVGKREDEKSKTPTAKDKNVSAKNFKKKDADDEDKGEGKTERSPEFDPQHPKDADDKDK